MLKPLEYIFKSYKGVVCAKDVADSASSQTPQRGTSPTAVGGSDGTSDIADFFLFLSLNGNKRPNGNAVNVLRTPHQVQQQSCQFAMRLCNIATLLLVVIGENAMRPWMSLQKHTSGLAPTCCGSTYIFNCAFTLTLWIQTHSLYAAGAQVRAATFYDVLKADPQHKLIMRAVDADPDGKMKQLLQDTVPVTAFVPVDSVSAWKGASTLNWSSQAARDDSDSHSALATE